MHSVCSGVAMNKPELSAKDVLRIYDKGKENVHTNMPFLLPCHINTQLPANRRHLVITYIFHKLTSLSWLSATTVCDHYNDIIMNMIASQITSLTIVYSTVYSGADQRKQQRPASLAFVGGNSPGTGEFPAQKANNAENVSISWRHRV